MSDLLERKINLSDQSIIDTNKAKEIGLIFNLKEQEDIEKLNNDPFKMEPTNFLNPFDGKYHQFNKGSFHNIDKIKIIHKQNSWWEYIPDSKKPFYFKRHTGEIIKPGRMYTNAGSIPSFLQWIDGLKPWDYGYAYMIHDWEFDAHRCHLINKNFEEVRDTMMEAVKTMIEDGLGEKRLYIFTKIFDGIDSIFARIIWDKKGCALPH